MPYNWRVPMKSIKDKVTEVMIQLFVILLWLVVVSTFIKAIIEIWRI